MQSPHHTSKSLHMIVYTAFRSSVPVQIRYDPVAYPPPFKHSFKPHSHAHAYPLLPLAEPFPLLGAQEIVHTFGSPLQRRGFRQVRMELVQCWKSRFSGGNRLRGEGRRKRGIVFQSV